MTGLEKMQNQILDEARKNAEEILEQAKKEAAEIREAARMKGQEECSRILEKSRTEVKNTEERSVSSCALQKRQVLPLRRSAVSTVPSVMGMTDMRWFLNGWQQKRHRRNKERLYSMKKSGFHGLSGCRSSSEASDRESGFLSVIFILFFYLFLYIDFCNCLS